MTALALLSRRLVFVTGKGGVGKSTCATALAVAAARSGRSVLLCEMGARSVASDVFPISAGNVSHGATCPLPDSFPTLWWAHLDPHHSLQDYLAEHLKVPRLVKLATENRVLARLWQAAPSVNEMALLNSLLRLERARGADGRPRFDNIIVDLPATGHALAMLGVPRGILGMVRIGSLAQRAAEIDSLLHDSGRTAVCIVTLPEELPVNESVQLFHRLRLNLDVVATHVVINGVLPDVFEQDERSLLSRLAGRLTSGPARPLIAAAEFSEGLRRTQAQRIADLRAKIHAHFLEIGYSDQFGFGLVEHVAANLISG